MGQYYYVVNVTKEQYINPHKFGDGMKLMEFGASAGGTMTCLAVLLADGNGRGGGDCRADDPDGLIGSWAGDAIVIAGDYADEGSHAPEGKTLNSHASEEFTDISEAIRCIVEQDTPMREGW